VDLEVPLQVAPGQVMAGKYRIERLIGRGGMAAVFAAHHELLNQTVAVKVLLPHVAAAPSAAGRFLNEARAAARIRGEHVTAVMDVGTLDDGTAYIVLEYLEGEDLDGYLARKGRLDATEVVGFVLEALEAVAQAHALGIVHRDIKPSNLFLARRHDGTTVVKVLDFGISKTPQVAQGDVSSTASQVLLGSPGYMSPEQARSAKSVDARTDVWAFGVLLYRALTGEAPFGGENLTEVIMAIVERVPPPLLELRPDLPEGLDSVVARCMEKDREARYANVAELALALERFGGQEAKASVDRVCRTLGASRTSAAPTPVASRGPGGTLVSPIGAPPAGASPPVEVVSSPRTASNWSESGGSLNPGGPSRARLWGLLAGAVIVATAAGALLAVRENSRQDRESPTAAGRSTLPVAVTPATSASETTAPGSVAVEASPSTPPSPSSSTSTYASADRLGASSPTATPSATRAKSVAVTQPAASAAPTPAPASAKPNCNPDYVLDANGQKHFKPECFH
jgi:eukaryotic-like serine/threonine-protein kinase